MRIFKHLEWLPVLGALMFLGGHFVAAFYYPGSHQWDYNSVGYDVFRNFWCDLIWYETYTGAPNPASPIGIFTTVFLTLSLAVYFVLFANHVPMSNLSRHLIRGGGVISMLFASLIFTDLHTAAILISAAFAMIALVPMVAALVRNNYKLLVWWGALTIMLLLVCIFQTATKYAYTTLPFLQKIAFVVGLGWVIAISMKIRALKKRGAYSAP